MKTLRHPLPPVFDSRSLVLLLGSFPSPASRGSGFFYAHPQNRFWPVLAALFNAPLPQSNDARKAFLLEKRIALWDVLAACEIFGAADNSIRNPVPNDLTKIFQTAPIRAVFTTGQTAFTLYNRHIFPKTGRKATPLPSTSAANARMRKEDLILAYAAILPYLEEPC